MNWLYIPEIGYGKHRRKIIVDLFNNTPDAAYRVNCKYRPQLKDDPDLRYLIRKGFLKLKRQDRWSTRSRITFLIKRPAP
jgi:hypothetical protein